MTNHNVTLALLASLFASVRLFNFGLLATVFVFELKLVNMATTMTFSGVLETGMSFLRVTAVILLVSGILGGLGLSLIDSGDTGIGTLLLLISGLILIAGVIGLMQKLISDAFLEGFKAAKEDGRLGDGTKMDVNQTLNSGFQVIGIVLLTAIVSGILFGIGMDMIDPFSRVSTVIGTLLLASGCAVCLAMIMGMLARVIAEGVSFGASSTGVKFATGPDRGAAQSSASASSRGSTPEDSSTSETPEDSSTSEEWGDEKKRLTVFSVAVFVGLLMPWNTSRYYSLMGGGKPDTRSGLHYLVESYFIEEIPAWFDNIGSDPTYALFWILFYILPLAFVATVAFTWFKHLNGDVSAAIMAGKVHLGIFGTYIFLLLLNVFVVEWSYYPDNDGSYFQHIFTNRAGIWVSGIAGLALIPEVQERLLSMRSSISSRSSDSGPSFEDLDSDGDGVLSKEEVEASDEIPDGAFESMDGDGDGSVSEDEFDDFDFDFDEDDDEDE